MRDGETADYVGWADRIVTGTVTEVDEAGPGPDGTMSSAADVTFTVAVDQVFKGDVGAEIEVHTASGGASCGIDPLPGPEEQWLWFLAATEEGRYGAYLCGGSGPAGEQSIAEVVDLTGNPGTAGAEAGPADDGSTEAASTAAGGTDADEQDSSDAVPWGVGGIAVVLGAALVGVAVVRRRA